MTDLAQVLKNNAAWAEQRAKDDPTFFPRLTAQQSPKILWIGCADSRVPANVICGVEPGEIFVHRNVANLVNHTDLNCLSVVQYAVEVLKVRDVIVCGHYGCGGVLASMQSQPFGLIDNWLRHIRDVQRFHQKELEGLAPELRGTRMCELNVQEQVANLAHTTIIQDAWHRGQDVSVHGWIYGLEDGKIKDLDMNVSSPKQLPAAYQMASPG